MAPTPRAALVAAAGAPLALWLGLAMPDRWWLALAWLGVVVAACVMDALLLPAGVTATIVSPGTVAVGEDFTATLHVSGTAARVATALALDARLSGPDDSGTAHMQDGAASIAVPITARRRGTAIIGPLDLRWTGPLGLVQRLSPGAAQAQVAVTPDIRPAIIDAPQLMAADALTGAAAQPWRGEGGDFDTLVAFRPGIDRRRIDWKASARHMDLLAKEYRVERDSNIILAIDCGRLMAEPVDGLTRTDRATTAALLTAAVALRSGDRVGLFAFDARPQQMIPPLMGLAAFAGLQRAAAQISDSGQETNFALSLSALAGRLNRRSLIILFTEFVDTTTASLMLGAVGRLLKRHLLVCVVMKDPALEAQALARPHAPEDVTRAMVAGDLLRERRLVIARLRRMGIDVVEGSPAEIGPGLVRRYLAIKAGGRL
ncbi:DUF58 domain-containing protein [Sandarakinorhabdus sp.]|uniref:DUF58 domain-containing protein n=1 Tax=Sandarakinorhabdus sp. TaxID=1916663 RepID=UPI00286E035A|nr:DUF58 domain-containing protein [Sandarakinorhabdus sp.]